MQRPEFLSVGAPPYGAVATNAYGKTHPALHRAARKERHCCREDETLPPGASQGSEPAERAIRGKGVGGGRARVAASTMALLLVSISCVSHATAQCTQPSEAGAVTL